MAIAKGPKSLNLFTTLLQNQTHYAVPKQIQITMNSITATKKMRISERMFKKFITSPVDQSSNTNRRRCWQLCVSARKSRRSSDESFSNLPCRRQFKTNLSSPILRPIYTGSCWSMRRKTEKESPNRINLKTLIWFSEFQNPNPINTMAVLKRYVLRLFISIKYITANVVDRNNGTIVATASTVEHALKNTFECGRTCNAKAAEVVGEVLSMRLKVEGLEDGQGRGIHVDVAKEIERKGFQSHNKVWAVVNAMKSNGVKLVMEDGDHDERNGKF